MYSIANVIRQVASQKNTRKKSSVVAEVIPFRKHPSTEVRLKKSDAWDLSPIALAVYCRILWHARSNDHECFAQVKTLQLKGCRAKICDDSIRNGRIELEKAKLINVQFQKHGPVVITPIPQPKSPDDVFVPRNIVEDLRPRELALWCRIYGPDNGSPSGCLLPFEELIENLDSARSCNRAFDYMVKTGHIFKKRSGDAGRIRYALAYLHPDHGDSFYKWKPLCSNKKPIKKSCAHQSPKNKVSPNLETKHGRVYKQTYKRDKVKILEVHRSSDQHITRARYVDREHFSILNLNRQLFKTQEVREAINNRYREYGFTLDKIPSCIYKYGEEGMLYALAILSSGYIQNSWYRARFGDGRLIRPHARNPARILSDALKDQAREHSELPRLIPDEWYDQHDFIAVTENKTFEYRKPRITTWKANGDPTRKLLEAIFGLPKTHRAA